MSRREVVLLQMGGPATLAELRPFYERLFGDADLIQLPAAMRRFQPALARYAARARTRAIYQRYRRIGGGSPLPRHTHALARALEREMVRRGRPTRVHVAMRYSEPSAGPLVADLRARGPTGAIRPAVRRSPTFDERPRRRTFGAELSLFVPGVTRPVT